MFNERLLNINITVVHDMEDSEGQQGINPARPVILLFHGRAKILPCPDACAGNPSPWRDYRESHPAERNKTGLTILKDLNKSVDLAQHG